MLNLISRFFHRSPPPGLRKVPPPAQGPRKEAVIPAVPDPFDEPWRLLNGAEAAPRPWSQEEQDLVDRIEPLVLGHFGEHRPSLTSFPALAIRIIDLLNDPDLDMNQLLKAISPDPAIAVHILRVANSAMYSRGTEVQDMRVAVMRIGLRGVGEIAAGVAGRSLFDVALRVEYNLFGERWNRLFLDTMAVAFGSSQFAFEQQVGRADRAFQAGMFVDIGKTIALRSLAALTLAGKVEPGLPARVVDELLERVHVEVGCTLHQIWNLPAHLAELCREHHEPVLPDDPEHMDAHILRLVTGIHRLVLNPLDTARLEETRQSIQAMRLVRRGVKLLHQEMAEQVARVAVLYPAPAS